MSNETKEIIPTCTPVLMMKVGSSGWISGDDLKVLIEVDENQTPKFKRIINLLGNVYAYDDDQHSVKITRVDSGIVGESYTLDFSDAGITMEFIEKYDDSFQLYTPALEIDPDFITSQMELRYLSPTDLDEELRGLIFSDGKLYNSSEVMKVRRVLIKKLKKHIDSLSFEGLLEAFEEKYQLIEKYETIDRDLESADNQYDICELIMTQNTIDHVQKTLQNKFKEGYSKLLPERQEELIEKIYADGSIYEFLIDSLKQMDSASKN